MKKLLTEWRKYLKESAGPGKKFIYRGMVINTGKAALASQIRKLARGGKSRISEQEAGDIILASLKSGNVGESWTTNVDVASNFADVWEAENRGPILHVMFTAIIPEDFGYDPQSAGEEPDMFSDESEVRIPKGEEIEIITASVFIADKKPGKNWMKFRKVAHRPGIVRA